MVGTREVGPRGHERWRPRWGTRRRQGAALLGCALVAGALGLPASIAPAAAAAAVRRCPKAPAKPPVSTLYQLSGHRWDPATPIEYVVDIDRIASSQKARIADVKTAVADATRYTGLDLVYGGTETSVKAHPKTSLIQVWFPRSFKVTPTVPKGTLGQFSFTYNTKSQQIESADIEVRDSLTPGAGGFDSKAPTSSGELHILLHLFGSAFGLDQLPAADPEVMSSEVDASRYYSTYQPGDAYGLWKVGASAGCKGFFASTSAAG